MRVVCGCAAAVHCALDPQVRRLPRIHARAAVPCAPQLYCSLPNHYQTDNQWRANVATETSRKSPLLAPVRAAAEATKDVT